MTSSRIRLQRQCTEQHPGKYVNKRLNRSQDGFTLVEVLVAFVILGLTLTVMMEAMGSSARHLTDASNYLRAAIHGESLMESIGTEKPFRNGSSSGKFEDGFRWTLTLQPLEISAIDRGSSRITLWNVQVTIFWLDGSKEKNTRFETLRLNGERSAEGST